MTAAGRPLAVVQVVCSPAFAGVERHVAGLAGGLAARGHEVTVLGGDGARMRAELAATSVVWRPADDVRAALRVLARARGADIVHAHMTAAELAAVLTRPLHRARVVTTRHFARHRGSTALIQAAARPMARAIAAQIAVSDYVAGELESPARVIHSGVVAPAAIVPAEERDRSVLVVSRLEAEKRVDLALRVFAASGLAAQGWTLRVAGDGARRAELTELAGRLGIAVGCRFLGQRDDVPALLDAAGLLLATCPVEAFGLAVVEAMGHGLPVVAVAQGAHREILAASPSAALFDVDDPEAGARLLAALAGDAAARAAYGGELRRVQQARYVLARQAEQTEAVYYSVGHA